MLAVTYFTNWNVITDIVKAILWFAILTIAVVFSILWAVPIIMLLAKAVFVTAIVVSPILIIWFQKGKL